MKNTPPFEMFLSRKIVKSLSRAKESLFFCEKVVCIIDPETTDKTESILRKEFPQIIIEYQDRSLGDSDDGHQGK